MVKLKKNQIKELIRHSIRELTSERDDVTESKKRRFTVKEVRMWMKKLEENRYKKVYNSDARRVAWMVNNEGRKLDEMPISMKKKWTKAQYGRERYLATEFLKSKSEQMNESKLREQIREIIKEQLNEKKETNFQMNTRDMREVDKLLKKGKFKGLKMKSKGPKFILTVPKKMEDKVLSYLIQKNVKNINEV